MKNLDHVITEGNRLSKGEEPNLHITWKPWSEADYQVKYTDIYMGLETPHLRVGEILVSLWINVGSIPCSEFTEEGLTAADEAGVLPLEITEDQEATEQITLRGINYYANKFRQMPNTEAWPLYWQEREAQWLPYGRGFFYFVDIDHKLRKATGGSRRLDHLVLEIEHRRRGGQRVTCADWEELLERELGPDAVADFRKIMNGKLIEPAEEWFGGAFTISRGTVVDTVRGTVRENAYIWTRRPGVDRADL